MLERARPVWDFDDRDFGAPEGFPSRLARDGYIPHRRFAKPGGQECELYVCSPKPGLRRGAVELGPEHLVVIKVLKPDASGVYLRAIKDEYDALRLLDIKTGVPWLYERSDGTGEFADPNTVAWDGATEARSPYIVQDFIPGINLRRYMGQLMENLPEGQSRTATSLLSQEQWVHMSRALVSVLKEIHLHGIVHMDIKPDNIVVAAGGVEPWVIDFGSAMHRGRRNRPSGQRRTFLGTPQYFRDGGVSMECDVYAMTLTLAEFLTGKDVRDLDGTARSEAEARARQNGRPGESKRYLFNIYSEREPNLSIIPTWGHQFFEHAFQLRGKDATGQTLARLFEEAFPTDQWPAYKRQTNPWTTKPITPTVPVSWEVASPPAPIVPDRGNTTLEKLRYAEVNMATNIEYRISGARRQVVEIAMITGAIVGVALLCATVFTYVLLGSVN